MTNTTELVKKISRYFFYNRSIFFLLALAALTVSLLFSWNRIADRSSPINQSSTAAVLQNEPFFPLGFYLFNSDRRIRTLRELAEAGFNTLITDDSDPENYDSFLDEAERLGIHVIVDFRSKDPLAVVRRFQNKPAVLGWGIADDAGDHATSGQVLELHHKIKAIDPTRPTYLSVSGWSKKWAGYARVADWIGGQSYPIGYSLGNQPRFLKDVYQTFTVARAEADKHKRPVIANLQTFPWPHQRWPTAHEVYNMTYQALLSGVNGIIFYVYDDGKTRITDRPELWNELKSIVTEIKRLQSVLLKGTLTRLETWAEDVHAGLWTDGKTVYVIVVNSSSKPQTVDLKLSAREMTTRAEPLFANRAAGMVVTGGKLRGSIQPGDVHIYQLSM